VKNTKLDINQSLELLKDKEPEEAIFMAFSMMSNLDDKSFTNAIFSHLIGLYKDMDFNKPDSLGNYPIFYAIGNIELLDLLIKQGADVNSKNQSGQTAIMYSIDVGSRSDMLENIKFLIEKGADLYLKDIKGNNLLHMVAQSHVHQNRDLTEVTKFLLDNKVDINEVNKDGQTPLDIYAGRFNIDIEKPDTIDQKHNIVNLFLENGAELNEYKGIADLFEEQSIEIKDKSFSFIDFIKNIFHHIKSIFISKKEDNEQLNASNPQSTNTNFVKSDISELGNLTPSASQSKTHKISSMTQNNPRS
jgi:ankyrin repeat protein